MNDLPRLGQYVIVRAAGGGGAARAELALRADGKDPDLCVLKRLPVGADDGELEARLRRGAQIAVRLEHENIARTLRIERIEGELCVAQEFVEGVSLAQLMRQRGVRPLPLAVGVHVVREVARALGYAHGFGRQGIVHRDVTPENVMLSFDGEVKLVDFGIARSAIEAAATRQGVVVGHHSYVAPEAWEGGAVDCRADVFALGVVLWEVLTGRRAEESPDPTLPYLRELNPDVEPMLAQLTERAMAPAPADRLRSADELGAALAAFIPPGADPRRELAELLAHGFDVTQQRQAIAAEVAAVKQALRGLPAPASAPLAAGAAPSSAPPTLHLLAPVTASRRAPRSGPWVAATIAAVVATSGIGLLRTHGRTARSRALAEPLAGAPSIPPRPIAPPAPAATPEPAPEPELQPPPIPALPAGARPQPPHRVAGRAPETVERGPHLDADALLRRASDRWEHGDTAAAYTLARQAVGAGAGAPAHLLLGTLLINMHDFAAAGPELETAARLDPRDPEARRLLALLHETAVEQNDR
ncbi:MAG TPA: serine/threonine-protein kinase [Polyangia bacterium]|nr:serine/threonine-protein kinase [Polyangia bacterium]